MYHGVSSEPRRTLNDSALRLLRIMYGGAHLEMQREIVGGAQRGSSQERHSMLESMLIDPSPEEGCLYSWVSGGKPVPFHQREKCAYTPVLTINPLPWKNLNTPSGS